MQQMAGAYMRVGVVEGEIYHPVYMIGNLGKFRGWHATRVVRNKQRH
jgi:hypothetical protein